MFTLLMLIAHTISDFILQTNEMVKLKSELKLKGFFYHGIGLFIISIIMVILVRLKDIPNLVVKIGVLVLVHILIDYLKEYIQKNIVYSNSNYSKTRKSSINLLLFGFDQITHILAIILITQGTILEFGKANDILMNFIIAPNAITSGDVKVLFIIMYIAFSGAYLIPLIFNFIYANVDNYSEKLNNKLKEGLSSEEHTFIDEVKTGKYIGILERILILIFIYLNQLAAIGFIVALKSLARFKMMDSKIFSEYYLLGTLFSVVYTISGFFVFQRLL